VVEPIGFLLVLAALKLAQQSFDRLLDVGGAASSDDEVERLKHLREEFRMARLRFTIPEE
jgi:hypothetical protein